MIRQRQTITGDKVGNCFATCIAALMDTDVANVPNFCLNGNDEWFRDADQWLKSYGFRLLEVKGASEIVMLPGTRFIASGKSPRGEFNHSVICTTDESNRFIVEMDPHESDAGLDGPFTMMTMVVKA